MKNLAIIPARSGSKRLVDKNIKELNGKPLIVYAIEAARESNCFDEIMVSTDSKKYAKIVCEYNVSVPFLRSEKNSRDSATSWDTVLEVIQRYREQNKFFDTFCLLQPTSPLRTYQDIQNAYQVYSDKKAVSVVSVCECEHSPLWNGNLNEEHELVNFMTKSNDKQSYKKTKYYRLNGAIYIMQVDNFLNEQNLFGEKSYAYVMHKDRSIDIDDEFDFSLAEFLMGRKL